MDIRNKTDKKSHGVLAFVLLYYKDYHNTIECIESLLKLDKSDFGVYIVIVDNHSEDGAIEKIEKHFSKMKNIYFLTNDQNLGFAKGNNVGMNFARTELKADFVVALNTDTVIDQRDFLKLIVEEYKDQQFDVMGPLVKDYFSGMDQSPIYKTYKQNTQIKLIKDLLYWLLWKTYLAKIVEIEKNKRRKEYKTDIRNINSFECVCSGCCLVFSPHFFKRWNGFYSGTFLYREESILFYIVNKLGGKTYFSSKVMIRHKGGESTGKAFGTNERKKNMRTYSYRIESLKKELKLKQMNKIKLETQI